MSQYSSVKINKDSSSIAGESTNSRRSSVGNFQNEINIYAMKMDLGNKLYTN